MNETETQFHQEMLELYQRAKMEIGYNATRFLQMVSAQGGFAVARALLATPGHPEGLTRLWEEGRLDLSLEATILKQPWRALFTPQELATAEQRLQELGYEPYTSEFIGRLGRLYSDVRQWLPKDRLAAREEEMTINEEAYGEYKAPVLRIETVDGKPVARFHPVGAAIIAARGRVDLIGTVDNQPILYLCKGGPVFKASVSIGGRLAEESTNSIFRGVDAEGWYWLEDKRSSNAHRFSQEALSKLLKKVSSYE